MLRHIPDDPSFQKHRCEVLTSRTVWMWTMRSVDNPKLQLLHLLSNDWVEALLWRRSWYFFHYDYKLWANRVSVFCCLLKCDTVLSDRCLPVFRSNQFSHFSMLEMSLTSSGAGWQINQNAHTHPQPCGSIRSHVLSAQTCLAFG
jgi:hypothetical protein